MVLQRQRQRGRCWRCAARAWRHGCLTAVLHDRSLLSPPKSQPVVGGGPLAPGSRRSSVCSILSTLRPPRRGDTYSRPVLNCTCMLCTGCQDILLKLGKRDSGRSTSDIIVLVPQFSVWDRDGLALVLPQPPANSILFTHTQGLGPWTLSLLVCLSSN